MWPTLGHRIHSDTNFDTGFMSNEIVSGIITRVEVYALYVDTPKGPAYVLAPDVSTIPGQALQAVFVPGQVVELRRVRYVDALHLHQGRMYDGLRPTS